MQKLATARLFALMLGGFVLLRGLINYQPGIAMALALAVCVVLVMIWAPGWVATHVMPWARLQRFNADATPALAVSVLGWALLLLLLALVLYIGPSAEPAYDDGLDADLEAIIEEAGRQEAERSPGSASPVSGSPSPSSALSVIGSASPSSPGKP